MENANSVVERLLKELEEKSQSHLLRRISNESWCGMPSISFQRSSDVLLLVQFMAENKVFEMIVLEDLVAIDCGDLIELIYLIRLNDRNRLSLKTAVMLNDLRINSLSEVWPPAKPFEQEIAEMFGVKFEGNDAGTRMFLPGDWEGFPMRRIYIFPHSAGKERSL